MLREKENIYLYKFRLKFVKKVRGKKVKKLWTTCPVKNMYVINTGTPVPVAARSKA